MSYDLMVFDPTAAPRDPAGFFAWYLQVMKGEEEHNYDNPAVAAPVLQAWYREMIENYPAMNGPDAPKDDAAYDDDRITGYMCATQAIYVDFRWSVAEDAYRDVFESARKHMIGFFDASGATGEVWGPTPIGDYAMLFAVAPNGWGST
jgi:hypothetical protein